MWQPPVNTDAGPGGPTVHLPHELLHCIIDQVNHIRTLYAFCLVSKSMYDSAVPALYRAALDADMAFDATQRSIPHPSTAVASSPGPLAQRVFHACRHTPLALWAPMRPTDVATPILERIAALRPEALWTTYRVPSDACRPHWRWDVPSYVLFGTCAPIHLAARYGNCDVVSWLLEHRPRPMCPYPSSCSVAAAAAAAAAANGQQHAEPAVIDIIAHDACVCPSRHLRFLQHVHHLTNSVDCPAATALHLALCAGHAEVAKLLIRHGANWTDPVEYSQGVTGIMIMAANGMLGLLDWLLLWTRDSGNDQVWEAVNERDDMGMRAIDYLAVASSSNETRVIARRLMAKGSAIWPGPTVSERPLHFDRDWDAIAEYATDMEAHPLFSAARFNNHALIDELLSALSQGS